MNNMKATPILDLIALKAAQVLPNGVFCATVSCQDYSEFKALPVQIEFEGKILGRSAWNSDRHIAYFRSDKTNAAKIIKK